MPCSSTLKEFIVPKLPIQYIDERRLEAKGLVSQWKQFEMQPAAQSQNQMLLSGALMWPQNTPRAIRSEEDREAARLGFLLAIGDLWLRSQRLQGKSRSILSRIRGINFPDQEATSDSTGYRLLGLEVEYSRQGKHTLERSLRLIADIRTSSTVKQRRAQFGEREEKEGEREEREEGEGNEGHGRPGHYGVDGGEGKEGKT
ncbi:hypothetical protein TWF718_002807 [Orbilia javanica]|uniref:Uncharacterized protein n=1 Tax=Orbilia javanica TaxID=47235 RepID=A0AAN8MLF6_9PEZI